MSSETRAGTWLIALAFATIYLIWGSTYLAIYFAIETIPPLLMAGARFVLAGVLLYGWMRIRGVANPTGAQWKSAAIIGVLLLLGGNGGVTLAEQYITSSVAALLVATVPLWIVLFEWLRPHGSAPRWQVVLGVVIGFLGVALLVTQGGESAIGGVNLLGAALVIVAAMSWAIGSLFVKGAELPRNSLMGTAAQMMAGGLALIVVALLRGELGDVDLASISSRSLFSFLYLTLFGSIVAFSAYTWLLKVVAPTFVATYAYVNPVVAVFLGWLLADDPLTARTLTAAAIIISAVVVITTFRSRKRIQKNASPVEIKPAQQLRDHLN